MLLADRVIALALMGLSVYFMVHALVLPIGWVESAGPGGGAFPFWLSLVMLLAAGGILARSFISPQRVGGGAFFDRLTVRSVFTVSLVLIITIGLIPVIGAYLSLMLFLFWYLRIFGGHSWTLTASIVLLTPIFLFFFFEVTLKILLPKGVTEPFFLPLYAQFF